MLISMCILIGSLLGPIPDAALDDGVSHCWTQGSLAQRNGCFVYPDGTIQDCTGFGCVLPPLLYAEHAWVFQMTAMYYPGDGTAHKFSLRGDGRGASWWVEVPVNWPYFY